MEQLTMEELALVDRFRVLASGMGVSLADVLTDALAFTGREYGLGDGAPPKAQRTAVVGLEPSELEAIEGGDRWGPQKARFLKVYSDTHSTSMATARVGIAINTFYRWLYGDERFEAALRKCGWRPRGEKRL